MLHYRFVLKCWSSVLLLSMFTGVSYAGSKRFTGQVETEVVSPLEQVGTIKLKLDYGSKTETCGIYGKIVGFPDFSAVPPIPLVLEHVIVCKKFKFSTTDTIANPPTPHINPDGTPDYCVLDAREENVVIPGSGTGRFEGVTGSARAEGTIGNANLPEMCPPPYRNSFFLRGRFEY
jgi:hypothetical protein